MVRKGKELLFCILTIVFKNMLKTFEDAEFLEIFKNIEPQLKKLEVLLKKSQYFCHPLFGQDEEQIT